MNVMTMSPMTLRIQIAKFKFCQHQLRTDLQMVAKVIHYNYYGTCIVLWSCIFKYPIRIHNIKATTLIKCYYHGIVQ